MTLRRLLALFLLALGLGGTFARASAHALLVRSIPEANAELGTSPASIDLWFSEPVEREFTTARLLDSSGEELPTGQVTFDPSDSTHVGLPLGQLRPGIYTVAWQTLSQVDGHEWFGSYAFTVLNPDGTRPSSVRAVAEGPGRGELPSVGEVSGRWLALVGSMLIFGSSIFLLAVIQPSNRSLWGLAAKEVSVVVVAAAAGVALGEWLQIGLQAGRLGGLPSLSRLVLDTRSGQFAAARQALAMASALVVLAGASESSSRREQALLLAVQAALGTALGALVLGAMRGGVTLAVLAALAAALGSALALWGHSGAGQALARRVWGSVSFLGASGLLAFSAGSHAGAVPGWVWSILGDYVHLLAASVWVGGLLLLPAVLWRVRNLDDPGLRAAAPAAVRRFSLLATVAVFALVSTGIFSALVQLPDLPSLWRTAYGKVLLVKLVLLTGTLGIAFLNNRLVHGAPEALEGLEGLSRLSRRAFIELFLAAGLMIVVAVLVQTPSPRSFAAQSGAATTGLPFNAVVRDQDLSVHLQVAPNRVGVNRFWAHLYHDDGSPIGETQLVRLIFEPSQEGVGQSTAELQPLGRDTFAVEGAFFSQPGDWHVSVYVRRRGVDDVLAATNVNVPPVPTTAQERGPWQNPAQGVPALLLIGGALAVLGLSPLLWGYLLRRKEGLRAGLIKAAGGTLVATGLVLGGLSLHALLSTEASRVNPAERDNPIPATTESIALGRSLYEQQCLVCHGPEGLGDGPLGMTLNPRPANLQVHMIPGVHTDGQIFEWITNGFPDSSMPAFADQLSEDERWHILNYLRTLAPEESP